MTLREPVDLENCDREPIHVPGAIQAHGCLIACDADLGVVRRYSANAAAMLGLPFEDLAGRSLEDLLGRKALHDLRNVLARWSGQARPGQLTGVVVGSRGEAFDISVHHHGDRGIVEFERSPGGQETSRLDLTRVLTARLGQFNDVDSLVRKSVRLLQAALGYDRVMIYRFAPDGSGEVISEARQPHLESFLGQHFPASDIPRQARQLYLQNTIRVVGNAGGAPVELLPAEHELAEPLDLTHAHLRSVSPIHCEYLRNMGVAASMSISILRGDRLWGLIACHHYSPRTLSLDFRVAAEMFGEFFSLHLEVLSQREMHLAAERARQFLNELLRDTSRRSDVFEALRSRLPLLAEFLACDGIGLWMGGRWAAEGETPAQEHIARLADHISGLCDGRVWTTVALPEAYPPGAAFAGQVTGVAAVPLSHTAPDFILFFRKERLRTIQWGGDPNKTYATGEHGARLTPRRSFAIWKETVEGRSADWRQEDLDIAEAARVAIAEVILRHNQVLAEERDKAELRQKILNEELNHRVKNILALIQSLVSFPVEAGRTLRDYVDSLKGRIQALAHAHDQVVRGEGGGPMRDLLEAEISPYRNVATIAIDGPAVALDSRAFAVMALVFHELATNAAKYGALSTASGRLDIAWSGIENGDCAVEWLESGGPPVREPERRGFGSILLERSIRFDLGGSSDVLYAPGGFRARFRIPQAHLAWRGGGRSPARLSPAPPAEPAMDLAGLNVLLAEDQLLVALDAEMMLGDLGAVGVAAVSSVGEARRWLASATPDLAVLDVNLGGENSIPIARVLAARGVPFIFATGYTRLEVPDDLSSRPFINKPYDIGALSGAIRRALAAD